MRLLTLLFLSLVCTCARAQVNGITPPAATTASPDDMILTTGLVAVTFGDEEWTAEISSPNRYEVRRYVTARLARQRPQRYQFHEVVSSSLRYDLRMVHRLIAELQQEGWQLTGSDYGQSNLVNPVLGDEDVFRERLFYHFRVPLSRSEVPMRRTVANQTLAATVAEEIQDRLRGSLVSNTDGTYGLIIEEFRNRQWRRAYTMNGAGILAPGTVENIKQLHLDANGLRIELSRPEGLYRYSFRGTPRQGYYLLQSWHQRTGNCGLLEYNVILGEGAAAQVTGYRRPDDCAGTEKPTAFATSHPVQRPWLRDFNPGSYRIELPPPFEQLTF